MPPGSVMTCRVQTKHLSAAPQMEAHMTSVVVHVSPLLLSYGLRWYAAPVSEASLGAKHFQICDGDADSCLFVPFQSLLCDTLVHFYLWWLILYYVWIFVALGSYIERHSYQTLWDRILAGWLKGCTERKRNANGERIAIKDVTTQF